MIENRLNMQLRNTSALAFRGISSLSASSSCARRTILSSSSSLCSHYSTTSISRSAARPAQATLRPALAPFPAQSTSSVFSTHIRTMASQVAKIKVKNPVVELDGDEVCNTFFFSSNKFSQPGCVHAFKECEDSIGTPGRLIAVWPLQSLLTNHCVSRCCPCPTLMHHMQLR